MGSAGAALSEARETRWMWESPHTVVGAVLAGRVSSPRRGGAHTPRPRHWPRHPARTQAGSPVVAIGEADVPGSGRVCATTPNPALVPDPPVAVAGPRRPAVTRRGGRRAGGSGRVNSSGCGRAPGESPMRRSGGRAALLVERRTISGVSADRLGPGSARSSGGAGGGRRAPVAAEKPCGQRCGRLSAARYLIRRSSPTERSPDWLITPQGSRHEVRVSPARSRRSTPWCVKIENQRNRI